MNYDLLKKRMKEEAQRKAQKEDEWKKLYWQQK